MYSFVKFVREFIKYEPLHSDRIGEPEEHLGLAIVTFPSFHNKQITIECGNDRKIYCDCINWSYYKDGNMIPLEENQQRHIIVKYDDLTSDEDAKRISQLINKALDDLYGFKQVNDITQIIYNQLTFNDYFKEIFERLDDLKEG